MTTNKYMTIAYNLYSVSEGGENHLEEQTAEDEPFAFITGLGIALPAFEEKVAAMNSGEEFDFTLTREEAYGEIDAGHIVDLPREVFVINNHFDSDNVFPGAILPMRNEDGNHFLGRVMEINDVSVRMDMNHPLAGKDLRFTGRVVESRDATNEELQHILNHLNGGCNCDDHDNCHNCNR